MCFGPRGADDSVFGCFGYDDDAIFIGGYEVTGREANAVQFHGNIQVNDALSIAAVVGADAAGEDGKFHGAHFCKIAYSAINDDSDAASIAGGGGQEFAPDTGADGTTGGADEDIIGLAGIDGFEFEFVGAGVDMGHVGPECCAAATDEDSVGQSEGADWEPWGLVFEACGIECIAQERYGEHLSHHSERDDFGL